MTSLLSKKSGRYLLIVENLPVPFDRRVWQQACALRDAGHQVTVICPGAEGYETGTHHVDGIRVRRHPRPVEAVGPWAYLIEYGSALFWEAWLTLKAYRQEGFEVIQVANPPDLLCLVALPYKVLGVPLVYDQHDFAPELFEAKYQKKGFIHRVLRWFERLSYRVADHVLATNESYRDKALQQGVASDCVTVVRNGPDLSRVCSVPPRPELKRGASYLLLFVGIMGSQEGLEDLITLMQILRDDFGRRDIHLVLAGDGSARAPQEVRARELDLDTVITFSGMLEDDDLIPLLNTADICLAPDPKNSMNDQSTMLKVMEYMAVGKPIVQYDLKEGRATAREASLYARPGNPAHFAELVQALLEDEGKRLEMGAAGAQRVREELQWSCQVASYLGVLESLAGS